MGSVKTREGVDVPLNVEFVEKRSNALLRVGTPLVGGALLTAALLSERAAAAAPPELQNTLATARDNPYKSLLAGTTLAAGMQHGALRGVRALKRASFPGNPADLESVDVGELLAHIGAEILRR